MGGAIGPMVVAGGGGHGHGHGGSLAGRTIHINNKPYSFQKRLGAGAFGAVYSARSPAGRNVAIKVIEIRRMSPGAHNLAQSYLNEVQHLVKLRQSSNHVVHIHDFGFDDNSGRAFIVMDLGDENLAKYIERQHAMNQGGHGTYTDTAVRKEVWRQLVRIIHTLTTNDIVHMDLKPDNLILFGKTIKIADLGISKKPEMLHQAGVGTPHYSAPEIMTDMPGHRHTYGPKADVWSLGAILYYMTYGHVPMYNSRAAEPPFGQSPSRDPDLIDALRRTLVVSPHGRADIFEMLRHPYTTR